MKDFDDDQLRRLDITLLLVFEEAMAHGKLSAAAKRLGLTQSAISHALKRLREVFDDALFIRTPRGVQPTQRALALRAPLAEALRLISDAVGPAQFDPARDDRVFRIAAPDYETSLIAPLLFDPAMAVMPRFVFRALVRDQALDALQTGDIDLLLGYTSGRGRACDMITLFEEDYLVVAREGHPAVTQPLDLAAYTRYGHVLVSPGGSLTGIVDRALATSGASRHVVMAVPYFFAALATVARTNLIATLPRRLAVQYAADFNLASVTPPLAIRPFPVRMIWSRRLADDPAQVWMRNRIKSAAGLLPDADEIGRRGQPLQKSRLSRGPLC